MRVTLKATGAVMLTDELRSYVEEKIAKLGKLLEPGGDALVEVELEAMTNARTGRAFRAEINLTFTGSFARAEAARDTLHAAIDAAAEEAKREVRRTRGRRRDLVRRGAGAAKRLFRRFGR